MKKVINRELFELVKSGVKPMIRVIEESHIEATIWDNGMIGRLESVGIEDEGTEFECLSFGIREDEFRGINEGSMNSNWYDQDGNPILTYVTSGNAPKDGVEVTYIMPDDTTFEIVKAKGLIW